MKNEMRVAALGILLAACLAGSCKKNDSATREPVHHGTLPAAWFQLIPADSPIVMANLRPVPDAFVDWLAGGLAPMGEMLEKKLQEQMAETRDEQERAVLAELQGKLSRDGLRSIGVSLQPRFAIYAIGLSLAMRMELADGKRFADFLDRIEAASGKSMDKAALEGIPYRVHTDGDVSAVLAIRGNELVLGVMHANARALVLPVLLGQTAPEATLADTRALDSLVEKYGLMGVSPGYLDIQALVRMLSGRGSALSSRILAASGIELPPLSATCHQELDRMAAVAPRIAFGYRSLSEGSLESLAVWELRQDLAGELAALRAPVPGVGAFRKDKPLFALALGVDVNKALAWAWDKTQVLEKSPFQCELLGELNEFVAELGRSLESELPPFVTGFKGAALAVSTLSMGGFMPGGTGYLLLGMDDPMALVELGKSVLPQLDEVEIQANGKPAAIPLGIPGLDTLHLAVQGSWIGAAVGPGMIDRVAGMIREQPAANGPLVVLAYNYKQLVHTLEQLGGLAGDGEEGRMMKAIGNMLGFSLTNLSVDDRGLVMLQTIEPL